MPTDTDEAVRKQGTVQTGCQRCRDIQLWVLYPLLKAIASFQLVDAFAASCSAPAGRTVLPVQRTISTLESCSAHA